MNDHPIERLEQIMAKLRDPETGCPWDREQTWLSLLEHTIEEAYEVADAIEQNHVDEVPNELGDLLFQVIFYSQIAEEEGKFTLTEVIERLSDKLERRHPHVFGDLSLEKHQLEKVWHNTKANERQKKALHSALDDIPLSLPALTRAQKLQRRAANEGFDWPDHQGVLDKVDEELQELSEAVAKNDAQNIEEEMGDLLFTMVNLSRHMQLDAETCLRRASNKFEIRYRRMEELIRDDKKNLEDLTPAEMEAYWQRVKNNTPN